MVELSGGSHVPRHALIKMTGPKRPVTRPARCLPALVGSERVRRHSHRRARSAPQCGVSRGPRAYWVRVPCLRAVITHRSLGAQAAELSSSAIF